MSKVFPRVTKCTFQKYGPSGTIQNHDAQVFHPLSIISTLKNEYLTLFETLLFYSWSIYFSVCFPSTLSMKRYTSSCGSGLRSLPCSPS